MPNDALRYVLAAARTGTVNNGAVRTQVAAGFRNLGMIKAPSTNALRPLHGPVSPIGARPL
jgi:hypothetical protein